MRIFIFVLMFFVCNPLYAKTTTPAKRIEELTNKINNGPTMELYLSRARAYIDKKEYSSAIYDLDKVIREDNYHLEAYVLKAKADFFNNNYRSAKKSLNEVFSGITYDLYKGTSNNLFAEAYYIRSQIKKSEDDESWQADYDKAISMGYKEESLDENKAEKSNTQNSFKYPNRL
ncbi:hypothetical protein HDR59_01265 [bacterium]|nr:hypothetical protein [bacterium]